MQYGQLKIDGLDLPDGGSTLKLSGELDMTNTNDLSEAIDQCSASEPLIVDTTELGFIDSFGLSALVTCRTHWGEAFTLIPGPAIRRLLDITGTREYFGL